MEKIKNFIYQKADGSVSHRSVYLVHEDASYYVGFDTSKLSDAELSAVKLAFDTKPITPKPSASLGLKVDYDKLGVSKDVFRKAYRTFLKANIIH